MNLKGMEFWAVFDAEDEDRLSPFKDDKLKNAEITPFQARFGYLLSRYTNSEFKKTITIDKKSYKDSILFDTKKNNIHSEIAYKLNGLYNTMSFELIKITDVTDKDAYFCIMADMEILASAKLADLKKTSNFSISLDNVDTLRFFSVSPDKNIKFIITNICTN